MSDKPWKVFERKIGSVFGTSRALMKGTGEVKDIGPEDDFPLVLDCKLRKQQNWQIPMWFKKLEDACIGTDRWPVLCLREPGKIRSYALVDRTRIMKFIVENTSPPITANDIYHWKAKGFGPKALVNTWDVMMKALSEAKKTFLGPHSLSADVIPMVSMENGTHKLTAFRPEDLAHLFRIGGVLQNAKSQN